MTTSTRAWKSYVSPLVVTLACGLIIGCHDSSLPTSSGPKIGAQGPPPQPPPPPADPAIACIVGRKTQGHNYWDLKVMNTNGSNATTVFTHNSVLFMLPSWSPDGHSITASLNSNVWRIDVAVVAGVPVGSYPTVLVDRTSTLGHPAWSPLGDQIAFYDLNQKTIETIPAGGGAATVRYISSSPLTFLPSLAWSPDATRIAFTEDGAIRVLTLGTGVTTTVLGPELWQQQGVDPPRFLDWARTQDVLAFYVGAGSTRNLAIYTLPLATGTPTLVVRDGANPTWSPDDQKILYEDRGFKLVTLATGQVTSINASGDWPDWRRF